MPTDSMDGVKMTGPDDHGWDDDEYDPDDDDCMDECGMMPDGQCVLAGSEWCDWDCPRFKPTYPPGRAALEGRKP